MEALSPMLLSVLLILTFIQSSLSFTHRRLIRCGAQQHQQQQQLSTIDQVLWAASAGNPKQITLPPSDRSYYWELSQVAFSLLPLSPGSRRRTIVQEVVKDKIWTLDQLQGIVNVNVPVRSTIIKLSGGGLFVYNPVAPTKECLKIVRGLEEQHGQVQHIVLGTVGLEHKALAGPFSQYFKNANIWIQPGQWSFPINLPSQLLGFPIGSRTTREIPLDDALDNPWAADFEFRVLGPLRFKSVGAFSETAFYHRDTKTLLVTDIIVKVGDQPPPIILEDPRAILFHSRNEMLDDVQDTGETRLRGWRRMVLFGLVFYPASIRVSGLFETLGKIPSVSSTSKLLGEGAIPFSGGLYPWSWVESEIRSFKSLQGGLLVAPILSELILNREPDAVLRWVEDVCRWDFQRIIPCHLENDIAADKYDFSRAFDFLRSNRAAIEPMRRSNGFWKAMNDLITWFIPQPSRASQRITLPRPTDEDLFLLRTTSEILTRLGVVAPPRVLPDVTAPSESPN